MEKFRLCAFADEADKAISGQVKALHENEIKLIELRGVDGKNVADLIPSEAQGLKKRFDCEGIAVWSIGSPIGKVDITSPAADELDRFSRPRIYFPLKISECSAFTKPIPRQLALTRSAADSTI